MEKSAAARVILNDRCLRNPTTGVGRYVTELLSGLKRTQPEIEILPFYSHFTGRNPAGPRGSGSSNLLDDRGHRLRSSRVRPSLLFRRVAQAIYETAFEIAGTAAGYTLYHEPNHIAMPWHGPILTTVHDLSVLRHPEWHPADRVAWYERELSAGVARTHHFIAVSQFTRDEMVALLGIAPERITVIPLGVDPAFRALAHDTVEAGCQALGLEPGFLLYVGTLEPRKNIAGLLEAYALLPPRLRARHPLVLAGMQGWGRTNVLEQAHRLDIADSLRVLGYVPDAQLPLLYNAARALVWPTLYEGFGLPPLEALACGTIVITSHVASIPEVVGEAATLVDPLSVTSLRDAMQRAIEDDAGVLGQRDARKTQAQQFTWDRCAAEHAGLYRRFQCS